MRVMMRSAFVACVVVGTTGWVTRGGSAIGSGKSRTAMRASASAPTLRIHKKHEVLMVGDQHGYRYEPSVLTIEQGDTVSFILVSGGPHNIAFDTTGLSDVARTAFMANMTNTVAMLSSAFLIQANEAYIMSFANIPAGTYAFRCLPHEVFGQVGKIIVTVPGVAPAQP